MNFHKHDKADLLILIHDQLILQKLVLVNHHKKSKNNSVAVMPSSIHTAPLFIQLISFLQTKMLSDICEELVIGSPERPLDPLYVQPASLELATIRKKQGEELVGYIPESSVGHVPPRTFAPCPNMACKDICP